MIHPVNSCHANQTRIISVAMWSGEQLKRCVKWPQVLHADAIGSRISSCLPLHLPGSGQAQQPAGSLALEAAGKLVLSRGTQREPERNMYTQAHCSFGTPACALLPGMLRPTALCRPLFELHDTLRNSI